MGAPSLQAVILCGGRARRAGGLNKSLIVLADRPLIEHQLERLRPIFADRITVMTDRPGDFEPWGLKCLPDPVGSQLPGDPSSLRGLAAALLAHPGRWCFLLAADMPWPDADLLGRQGLWLERRRRRGRSPLGVCLSLPGGIEPFHAVYHASLAASAIRFLATGRRAVREWIAGEGEAIGVVGARELGVAARRLDRCLANVNFNPNPT